MRAGAALALRWMLAWVALTLAVHAQEPSTAWIGAELSNLGQADAAELGLDKQKGAKITSVFAGGPASVAHLQPGDIIMAIGADDVVNMQDFAMKIQALPVGSAVSLTLLRSGQAIKQEVILGARFDTNPDPRPILRIEPGMHTAGIWRIGVDAACTQMATGSDDKTVRLWVLPQGGGGRLELVRTLRVPIGDGNEGKVYAVALSPDGKWAAAGGWNRRGDHWVYIFEAATGRLVNRLGRLGYVIRHLVFSADGNLLAATLAGGEGMRLWETGSWQLVADDKDYGGKDSYGAAFDNLNRLYTVAYDGQIRRYGADGRLEALAGAKGGKEPFSIALHPRGGKLAVGFNDTTAVEVYESQSLNRAYAANTAGVSGGNLSAVAWSAGGSRIFASGRYVSDKKMPILIWHGEGKGKRSQAPFAENTVTEILPCGDDGAAGAFDPAFGLIGPDGTLRAWQDRVTADARKKMGQAFTISGDGRRVRFGLGYGVAQPVLFDLGSFALSDAAQNPAGLSPAKTGGLAVSDWEDTTAPKLNGKPIANERSRALAVAPDAARFVLGMEYRLRAYRADGSDLWSNYIPGVAWGVNISGNGRLVVVAYGDGTIRWHRLSDGQELLALFVHAKDRRYVAWTPKGYYAASPGAEDLIGWHVNRDWDHAPDFYPASRFREQFNRPDVVKRVLDDLDEVKAVSEANQLAGPKPSEELAKKLPPVITIRSPGEGSPFSSDSLIIHFNLRSPSGLAISEVAALVDGRPLPGATIRGIAHASAGEGGEQSLITLTGLPPRDLTLSLVARTGELESTPASIRLKFKGAIPAPAPAPSAAASAVSLYALVVGVSKFKDPNIKELNWAAKDARDFAAALKGQEGRLYRKVEVKLLADEDATNGAILNSLSWLKRQVGQGDVGVVFLAGHGITDPSGDYYYVPYNAEFEDVAGLVLPTRATAVPDSEISRVLKELAGNALFFFDTCHAGKAAGISFRGGQDYNKLINEIAGSANAVVLASSTGSELSQERDDWHHGAFTFALLEGFAGKAFHYTAGIVTIDELNLYVKERVKELTGGLQHPVDLKPKEARNFAFAAVP
jgi:WD40 repeat protein